MRPSLNEYEAALLLTAQTFASEHIRPNAANWELERTFPQAAFKQAASAGLCRLLTAPEHGGHGISSVAMARIMETVAAASMPFAFALTVHNNLANNIATNGTPQQREIFLPALLSGESIGAFLLTEPQSGSDAAAITTTARQVADGWILDGAKAWVSNGAVANTLSVYAQTDPQRGWRGIACFLVDAKQAGVIREPAYAMLGGHALGTGAFRFDNCRLGSDALMIAPGDAFRAALQGIDIARIMVSAMCCGMLQTGLQTALEITASRRGFGRNISQNQGIRWMLADVATNLEAATLLTDKAATLWDAGEDATLAAAHAKKFATRVALSGLSDCMQSMGAQGLQHDHPLARHFASAKMAQYLDGTTEIQNVVISRKLWPKHTA